VTLPVLPPGMIRLILEHIVPTDLTKESLQASYSTLTSVCLASKELSEIGFEFLYRHVFLPTQVSATKFVETIRSARWEARLEEGKISKVIRSIWIVRNQRDGTDGAQSGKDLADNEVITCCLDKLDRQTLRGLTLENATLYVKRLTGLEGETNSVTLSITKR